MTKLYGVLVGWAYDEQGGVHDYRGGIYETLQEATEAALAVVAHYQKEGQWSRPDRIEIETIEPTAMDDKYTRKAS